jgi:hypothetical protein
MTAAISPARVLVAPRGGAWMKQLVPGLARREQKSRLAPGAWIELVAASGSSSQRRVAPRRGARGLKTTIFLLGPARMLVAPRAGRVIETVKEGQLSHGVVAPRAGAGVKLQQLIHLHRVVLSPPRGGAWFENPNRTFCCCGFGRATARGAGC